MNSLNPDENCFLESKIDNNLIRTGTLGEGTCFFHSILKAIDPIYNNASEDTKIKIAKKVRENISDSVTLETYKNISGGLLAKITFDYLISSILKKLFDKKIKDKYGITKFITFSEMDSVISNVLSSCGIDDCSGKFESIIYEQFSHIPTQMTKDFSSFLFSTARNKAVEKFKQNVKDCSYYADDTMFILVSTYLNIDIYFITEETGNLYIMPGSCENITSGKRNAVIIGSINGSHFENIGYRKSSSGPNKGIIERVFEPDHPLIEKLQKILRI